MPSLVVLNRNALSICQAYRNYLGGLLKDGQKRGVDVDLTGDILGRSFRKAMDCPETWIPVMDFWNNNIK